MQEQRKFHLSLFVSDIDQSVQFYQKLFQKAPSKVETDYLKFELDNPGLVISFLKKGDQVSSSFGHLGFKVSSQEELEELKSRFSKELEIALEEQHTTCCYAQQNKFWVNDPDGYEWEVYHFLKDVEQDKERTSMQACC